MELNTEIRVGEDSRQFKNSKEMPLKNDSVTSITVCSCAFRQIINREEVIKLVSALKNAGRAVAVIPDLCNTAITDTEKMAEIASTTVVACYSRAVKSIFDSLGLKPCHVIDIRNHTSEQILNELEISQTASSVCNAAQQDKGFEFVGFCNADTAQEAWYPVIDKERCTECGKCHDFCLFGVYSVKNGEVRVTQPRNCKNNCPACARLCPSRAIIFPKYDKSPINGGLHDEAEHGETDTKELYNIALKQKLAERRAKVSLLKN